MLRSMLFSKTVLIDLAFHTFESSKIITNHHLTKIKKPCQEEEADLPIREPLKTNRNP